MAALLTSVADNKDKSAIYLSECRRLGIPYGVGHEFVEQVAADPAFGVGHAAPEQQQQRGDHRGPFEDALVRLVGDARGARSVGGQHRHCEIRR